MGAGGEGESVGDQIEKGPSTPTRIIQKRFICHSDSRSSSECIRYQGRSVHTPSRNLAKIHLHGTLLVSRKRGGHLSEIGIGGLHKGLHGGNDVLGDLALEGLCFQGLDNGDEGSRGVTGDSRILSSARSVRNKS